MPIRADFGGIFTLCLDKVLNKVYNIVYIYTIYVYLNLYLRSKGDKQWTDLSSGGTA